MTEFLAYLNGEFIPQKDAAISFLDAGFTWGATVVDNCRTYHGKLFRWQDHLARFRHDCQACFVPLNLNDEQITNIAKQLIKANYAGQELQLVSFATPGLISNASPESTLGMMTYPVPVEKYERWINEGVTLTVARNLQNESRFGSGQFISPTIKHRSRMTWWVAEKLNQSLGYPKDSVALFFDEHGSPTETAYANVLCVRDGVIYSPQSSKILDGISLKVAAELCGRFSIPLLHSEKIDVTQCDEILFVGTGFGIARTNKVLDHPKKKPIFTPRSQIMFDILVSAWNNYVDSDVKVGF